MAIFLEISNNTAQDVDLGDLGAIVPANGSIPLGQFNKQDLSRSRDLTTALSADLVSLVDLESNRPMDTLTAIRDILTGGGHSVVNREGLMRVHASPRPLKTLTYFTCAGDAVIGLNAENKPIWDIGNGEELLFNLESTDASQSIDVVFSETVHIKDGYIKHDGAPLGSYIDFEVIHPYTQQPLNRFCNKIFMQGDGWFELNSDDSAEMPYGLILRITVHNSSLIGMKMSPASFKVTARLEMYRETTVNDPTAESSPI